MLARGEVYLGKGFQVRIDIKTRDPVLQDVAFMAEGNT